VAVRQTGTPWTDRNLLFARPPVLSAARVREDWFSGLPKDSGATAGQGGDVNRH
jgi:hypothetical protein